MHPYRPKGRLAHEGRSSRVGQAWTQNKVWVFNNDFGVIKKFPMDHFTCPKCNFVVEMDKLDCAFCPKCGAIFNDGIPQHNHKHNIHDIMRASSI